MLVSMSDAAEDLSKLPDPTRPQVGAEAPLAFPSREVATGPELQSTMISTAFRRAIISGQAYKQGDRVDGAVIMDIQPYEITLKEGGRETRLRLLPRLTKEPKTSAKNLGKEE